MSEWNWRDPDVFTDAVQQWLPSLYKIARSILPSDEDAADAIQETILISWEKIGQLHKSTAFRAWLTKILINICYDMLRKNRHITYLDTLPEIPVQAGYERMEWLEILEGIQEKYRIVLVLYYLEGFRTKDISRILEAPEATIRTRLKRARKELMKVYEEKGVRE